MLQNDIKNHEAWQITICRKRQNVLLYKILLISELYFCPDVPFGGGLTQGFETQNIS